jgi:hypothetical protein
MIPCGYGVSDEVGVVDFEAAQGFKWESLASGVRK